MYNEISDRRSPPRTQPHAQHPANSWPTAPTRNRTPARPRRASSDPAARTGASCVRFCLTSDAPTPRARRKGRQDLRAALSDSKARSTPVPVRQEAARVTAQQQTHRSSAGRQDSAHVRYTHVTNSYNPNGDTRHTQARENRTQIRTKTRPHTGVAVSNTSKQSSKVHSQSAARLSYSCRKIHR